jgi:hypothetical protein
MVLNIMERTSDRIGYPAMREAADELRKTAEVIDARQSSGQERGEAVSKEPSPEFTEWLLREIPPGTVISNPKWWLPKIWRRATDGLYATPPADAKRIAELEAQLRAGADNHKAAISALEDTMREVCGDNASLRAERDKYYQQVINVGAVAINSIPQEHYDNLQQQLTERTEQVERMREDIACLVDVWADQLRPERHYTETAFAELMDEAAAKLAALAAEKGEK